MKTFFYLLLISTLSRIGIELPTQSPQTPVNPSKKINAIDPTHPSTISVVPPSPEAASLGKYGEVPVSLYTGTPSIQIPLYNISQGDLSLPISVSYHASGVKIDEISSSVGINWALNAAGVITRTIHGNPDEQTGGYQTAAIRAKLYRYTQNLMTTTEKKEFEYDVADGTYDAEPDEYYYNFSGYSGRMVFDSTGVPVLLNHNKMKVEVITEGFSIVDEKGTTYYFTTKETVKPMTYCQGKTPSASSTSGWWLSEIKPAVGRSIYLHYNTRQDVTYTQGVNEQRTFVTQNTPENECQTNSTQCTSVFRGDMQLVDTIYFDKGHVEFVYESRADVSASGRRLQKMRVLNNDGLLIKQFEFEYEYGGGNTRFALKRILETTDISIETPTYVFDYDHFQDLPARNTFEQDHWGYYNTNTSGVLIPFITLPGSPTGYTWANREPDPVRTTYGMLSRITYPTKGYTDFEYEAHDYGYVFSNAASLAVNSAGGVRIKKMINRDGKNPDQDQTKVYEYRMTSDNTRSSGCLVQQFVYQFNFETEQLRNSGPGGSTTSYVCGFIEASSNSQAYLGSTKGGHIGYEEVTEYYDEDKQTGGKTTHKFSSFRDSPDTYLQGSWNALPFPPPTSKDEYRGLELKTTVYKHTVSGFSKQSEKEFIYQFEEPLQIEGIKMKFSLRSFNAQLSQVATNRYGYLRVWTKLTNEKETLYENGNSITTETNYVYNTNHLQMSQKEIITSAGDHRISRYKYPLDFTIGTYSSPSSDTEALSLLQQKNIVSALVEQTEFIVKNGSTNEYVTRSIYQSYKSDQAGLRDAIYQLELSQPLSTWQPVSISTTGQIQKHSQYTEAIKFDLYDQYGNILQQHKTNDIFISYGWGYNSTLPIVEARNMTYAELLLKMPSGFTAFNSDINIQAAVQNFQQTSPQSLIKGFIYIPLRGLSTLMETNGTSASFSYDNLNRLTQTKDAEAQIIKQFDYHYRQ
jgi:hypothetical protein